MEKIIINPEYLKLIEEIIDENNDKIENNEIIDNYVSIFGNDLIEMEDE